MSYRLKESRRSEILIPASIPTLPTHQAMCLTRAISPVKHNSARSIRSQKRELLRKTAELRVKIEHSIIAKYKRGKFVNKHIPADVFVKLMKDVPSAFAMAYKKRPELFAYV